MAQLSLKFKYGGEIRRLSVSRVLGFQQLNAVAHSLFSAPTNSLKLKYLDEDGDAVTIACQMDLDEALRTAGTSLVIHVLGGEVDYISPAPPTPVREDKLLVDQAQTPPQPQPEACQTNSHTTSVPSREASLEFKVESALNELKAKLPQLVEDLFQELQAASTRMQANTAEGAARLTEMVNEAIIQLKEATEQKQDVEVTEADQKTDEKKSDEKEVEYPPYLEGIPEPLRSILARPNVAEVIERIITSPQWDGLIAAPAAIEDFVNMRMNPESPGRDSDDIKLAHPAICDACDRHIKGIRYKCSVCADYDLCESCEAVGSQVVHEHSHAFIKIQSPDQKYRRIGRRWRQCRRRCSRAPQPASNAVPPSCISQMRFLQDVTFPDGIKVKPGQSFLKIWRVKNVGSIAWEGVQVKLHTAPDSEPSQISVNEEKVVGYTAPNSETELAIGLTAPDAPGVYCAYFRMVTPFGQAFGDHLWVKIEVELPKPAAPEVEPVFVLPFLNSLLNLADPEPVPAVSTQTAQPPVEPAQEISPATPGQETTVVNDDLSPESISQSVPEPLKYPNEVAQLIEMGFSDAGLTDTLLEMHDGNVADVLEVLLNQAV